MKRVSLFLCLFICFSAIIEAQTKISVNVCPQFNENFSLRGGADIDIPINKKLSFTPGIYWSERKRKNTKFRQTDERSVHTTQRISGHFINIPLRIGLRIPCKKENQFALKVLFGTYLAYGIKGDINTTIDVNDKPSEKLNGEAFGSEGIFSSRFDYGLNCALNATIKSHYKLGVFTECGLRKMYKADGLAEQIIDALLPVNNNYAVGLTIGYQF